MHPFPTYGHTIKATYHGDIWHNAGSGTMTQLVHRYSTTTTVLPSQSVSTVGQKVTFTATVVPSEPSVPTGSVQFFRNGTTLLGTAALSGGTAKFTKAFSVPGTFTITANYLGYSVGPEYFDTDHANR